MFSEDEARVWGGLLTAIGVAVMACGLVRLWWPAADWSLYAASGGIGFGFPLLVAGWKWLKVLGDKADAEVRTTVARAWALEVETATREARLTAAAPVQPAEPAQPDMPIDAWRVAAHRFVTAGSLYGFQVRRLASGEHKVIEWDDWKIMRDFLLDAGVLCSAGGTSWADGWNWDTWRLVYPTLALPYRQSDPPAVAITPNAQQKQRQQQEKQTLEGIAGG